MYVLIQKSGQKTAKSHLCAVAECQIAAEVHWKLGHSCTIFASGNICSAERPTYPLSYFYSRETTTYLSIKTGIGSIKCNSNQLTKAEQEIQGM